MRSQKVAFKTCGTGANPRDYTPRQFDWYISGGVHGRRRFTKTNFHLPLLASITEPEKVDSGELSVRSVLPRITPFCLSIEIPTSYSISDQILEFVSKHDNATYDQIV